MSDEYAWYDNGRGRQVYRRVPKPEPDRRGNFSTPMVISDGLDGGIRSMVDGRVYTSKAALRRSYRERGYVEVGNERLEPGPKAKPPRDQIEAAVGTAMSKAGLGA